MDRQDKIFAVYAASATFLAISMVALWPVVILAAAR
jgi:hypothetical protein